VWTAVKTIPLRGSGHRSLMRSALSKVLIFFLFISPSSVCFFQRPLRRGIQQMARKVSAVDVSPGGSFPRRASTALCSVLAGGLAGRRLLGPSDRVPCVLPGPAWDDWGSTRSVNGSWP
jgi:hypothetical protein